VQPAKQKSPLLAEPLKYGRLRSVKTKPLVKDLQNKQRSEGAVVESLCWLLDRFTPVHDNPKPEQHLCEDFEVGGHSEQFQPYLVEFVG
jgi:hypothetical protein